MIYIVGSGPAGIAAAHALLQKGRVITMLDAGIDLEEDRQKEVLKLRRQDAKFWDRKVISSFKTKMSADPKGVPLKLIYGSDYPYQEIDQTIRRASEKVDLLPSLAKGGLSNVWGATLLPYRNEDFSDWPFTHETLSRYYHQIFEFVPLAGTQDRFANDYPLYSKDLLHFRLSAQANSLLSDLETHVDELQKKGVLYGQSRLAVKSIDDETPGCVYCGLCLYGCPYGLIYSTTTTLSKLLMNPKFQYINNLIVDTVQESTDGITIHAHDRLTNEKRRFEGRRVLIGCGVLSSSKIILESIKRYDEIITIKDSQYFLLPILRYHKTKNIENEELHTLAQIFIRIANKNLGKKPVFLQIYTYNDLYQEALRKSAGPFYPLISPIAQEILGRMLVIQGYLHSDVSSSISLKLKKNDSKLILNNVTNPETRKILKSLRRFLMNAQSQLKAVPLSPLFYIANAGRGFHSGGSFPMKASPRIFESDYLGRPAGLRRTHLIDSSIFPSIPAGPITLTVMANAARIAGAVSEEPVHEA